MLSHDECRSKLFASFRSNEKNENLLYEVGNILALSNYRFKIIILVLVL